MLSVNTIARVVVNAAAQSAAPNSFDTGLLLVKDSNYADTRRLQSVASGTEAASTMTTLGFASNTEPYKAALKYFGVSPAPNRLLISCFPTSESPAEALAALLDITTEFYGVCLGQTQTDAEILALDTAIRAAEKTMVLFVPIIGTPSEVVATDSLLDKLYAAQSGRAVSFYCAAVSDAAAVMGAAMGLTLSHEDSAFALCYKTVNGITPSSLTQTQVTAIEAKNGNVYIVRGSTHYLLEKGSVASGMRYDEVMYLDMIANDLQNAAVALLAENTDKLPQTDDSTAQFINSFTAILSGYQTRGVLTSATWRGANVGPMTYGDILENGFALWASSYDEQSDVDRGAHKAMPISVALTLAGSIESIVITINVTL